jgi:ribosomal protein S18 acetylase RimI-like enzyme
MCMSRPVEVRPATTADVEALVTLWTELAEIADLKPSPDLVRSRVEDSLGDCGYKTLVALEDTAVVGFLNYAIELTSPLADTPAVVVSGMHVGHDERRRGVGAALLEAVLTVAEEIGATEISVKVPPEMRAANRYLAKLGFAPTLVRRSTTAPALRARLTPTTTRTRRAVLKARKAARQPVTAVSRVLQSDPS